MRLSLSHGASRAAAALSFALLAMLFLPAVADAQDSSNAQLLVRIQDLEQTVRDLTGQVQGLQFTLTQMQAQLQKMQDDNEFRFEQLEGTGSTNSSKKTSTPKPAAAPATTTAPAPSGGSTNTAAADVPAPAPLASTGGGDGQPNDGLGDSRDPLLGKGATQASATLGTLPASSQGMDLSLNSSQPISNGDAEAQYKAGYDAITRGDYAFAADQFKQFIALYPKDPQAPDATNWLGEALLQQQQYDDAADVLLTGFQNYQSSARAPDLLLKLGIALAGAGEQDTACRTFFEVAKRYPKQPAAFLQRLQDEKQKAKCPV